MNWRHELKFIIDEAAFHQLYFTLRPVMHRDLHAIGSDPPAFNSYRIRSLYFDDEGRNGIFEKLSGVDRRYKYRIRIYNDSDQVIHLEKKIKHCDLSFKDSCQISRAQVDGLLAGDPEAILDDYSGTARHRADQLRLQFYTEMRTRLLRPRLMVDYERIPLLWQDGNVRITFDCHLSSSLHRLDLWDPAAALQPVMDAGELIMEVKFDHFLPDFIRSAIQLPGISPLAISKYVMCTSNG
ncbi:MAG TPA: molecular chaperone [Clostridiales bacterium]|nr:molecular chaperone [Clostridiales bacterium]